MASAGRPRLRRGDPRLLARGGAQGDRRSTAPSDGGVVYGRLSLVQTHDAADAGGCVWCPHACRDDSPIGAGHDGRGSWAYRGGPRLRAEYTILKSTTLESDMSVVV